jgi:AcrR family transcriptional regulator
MGRKPAVTSVARQRLVETASRLFYREGVRVAGIDRIVAEAGIAKMTLYAHFPSKDDLLLAALQYREKTALAFFRSGMGRHGSERKTACSPSPALAGGFSDLPVNPQRLLVLLKAFFRK